MKPDLTHVLSVAATQLFSDIAPQMPPGYAQGSASTTAMILFMAAQEAAKGAAVLAADNAQMRALFARAADGMPDTALAARCREAGQGDEPSLLLADLDAANAALSTLLIELQIHAEARHDKAAHALRRAIWDVLCASAERRVSPLPPL